jgi:hypothetical protein
MSGVDLNKCAISMGKVIKLLAELDAKTTNGNDVYENKEEFLMLAYICRVGILDRIENNSYIGMEVPIKIPTGLFSSRKETIYSGVNLTVGKLNEIVRMDIVTQNLVDGILKKNRCIL